MGHALQTHFALCFICLEALQTVSSTHHHITNSGEVRIPVEKIGTTSSLSTGVVGACVCFVTVSVVVVGCVTKCRQRSRDERIYDVTSDRQNHEMHTYVDLQCEPHRPTSKDRSSDYEYVELPVTPRAAASAINQEIPSSRQYPEHYLQPARALRPSPDWRRAIYIQNSTSSSWRRGILIDQDDMETASDSEPGQII